MFGAEYFTYGGVSSSTYGLKIAEIGSTKGGTVEERDAASVTLALQKAPGSARCLHGGVGYESAPSFEFSVISTSIIPPSTRSQILKWLIGSKEFKPLTFGGDGGYSASYAYYCVFTSAKTILINGKAYGFRLTAQLDSQFARGTAQTISVTGSWDTTDGITEVALVAGGYGNGYIYPTISFNHQKVIIRNVTDDETTGVERKLIFEGNTAGDLITIDCELRRISSSANDPVLRKLTSKNWLRLRPGVYNEIQMWLYGSVSNTCTITWPNYAMIGY